MLRSAATVATELTCRAVGRGRVIRASSFVLRCARLDVRNELRTNGESMLQKWVLSLSAPGCKISVIDIGANLGRWSTAMVEAADADGRSADLDLHAFEPSAYTFSEFETALAGTGVKAHQKALGDKEETCLLHTTKPGAGSHSLHDRPGRPLATGAEEISITTLDSYVMESSIGHLALVKVDTEGHDLAVLRGASGLLASRRISVVQFEYNHRWVFSRSFLSDAFELLEPHGYRIGKLTPKGVEFYPHWDAELENFIEGNYVACLASVAEHLPSVTWWKSQ